MHETIEKDCLAIVFACSRFNQYLRGGESMTTETDHKPLVPIFQITSIYTKTTATDAPLITEVQPSCKVPFWITDVHRWHAKQSLPPSWSQPTQKHPRVSAMSNYCFQRLLTLIKLLTCTYQKVLISRSNSTQSQMPHCKVLWTWLGQVGH